MERCVLSLLAVLLLVGSVSALYDSKGPVALLGSRSFGAVTRSKVPVVVEFFAPWCGHCKALAPAFAKAAAKLEGIVPFVAVDCDQDANRPLCGQYGVQGFPTIKLFSPGAKGPSVRDYQGERSAKALADAALGMLTAKHVQRIKSASDAAEFAAKAGPKVLLVSDKSDTPAALKSLSQRFAPAGVAFARLQARDPAAAAELLAPLGGGLERVPTLMLLGADGTRTVYEGETKPPLLLKWLQGLVGGGKADAAAGGNKKAAAGEEGSGAKEEAAEQGAGAEGEKRNEVPAEIPQVVVNATVAELSRRLQQEAVFLLSFHAGSKGGCREHLNKLNAAAAGLQGLVTGVQVDLSQESEAAAAADLFSVTLPEAGEGGCAAKTFLLPFDPEDHEDADEWRPWRGELALRELHKAALELFPAGGVHRVTADTYQQLMAASGVDRVKVVLFSDKEEPPAVFRALSANFRSYKMDFGFVHSGDSQLMEQFKVPQAPYLVALFADPRAAKAGADGAAQQGGEVRLAIQPYVGPVKYGSIAGWLTVVGLQTGAAPEEALRQFGGGAASRDAMVAQITSPESWEASCLSHGSVCVVAALSPHAAEQAAQLEVLRAAAAGRADQPLRFTWFAFEAAGAGAGGGAGAAFAEELGLGGGAAPALVALAPRKQRSAVMTAKFEPDAVKEWLDGLLSGRVRTAPLHRLPAFPTAGDGGAGGAAAEAEAAADEFDLSDIMNEELEGDLSKGGRKDEL